MLKKAIYLVIFFLIILLAVYLRFANLGSNPSGLYVDEASAGYNAYSIFLIGKDEYGKEYPFAFRFFGSYTPPVYTYLTSVVVRFLDLSIFSTRFLSAFSGILMVFLIYFLVKDIVSNKYLLPLIGAFLMATNPWSLFYSRIGYEIHLAFLFFSIGVYFLWKALGKKYLLILGFGFLSLSSLTYHAERLLAPLVLITFFLVFKNDLIKKQNFKTIILSILVYVLISLPQILIFFTPANTSRGVGLFYSQAISDQAAKLNFLPQFLSFPASFIREFSAQYFSYFSPRSLFFEGDSDLQRSMPELSVFYPWMTVFLLIGILKLLKQGSRMNNKFILMLLLLSPIPASLTGDPFSTQRSLPMLLPLLLIMCIGITRIFQSKFIWVGVVFVLIMLPVSGLQLYRSYAVLLPNERATNWEYGFSKLAQEIRKRLDSQFVIDDSRMKPVYIELLFFLKYPPTEFHKTIDPSIKNNYYTNTSWSSYYKFGQVETRGIKWEEDIYKERILVGDELSISEKQVKEHFLTEEFSILSPTDEIIFRGYKTDPYLKRKYEENSKR